MTLTYSSYVTTMANLLVVEETNADFVQILPSMIDYATHRIENDLDLIANFAAASVACTPGTRSVTLPTPTGSGNGPIYIVQSASIITPAATLPDAGTRNPLQRMSVEALNWNWPTVTDTGVPAQFAMLDATTALLGPAPDAAYRAEFIGVYDPPVLSDTATTTWITLNLPELFIAASMVFGTGWQRDFGAQANDPQASQSWEAQYQALLQADTVQELRKKSSSSAWTAISPAPLANPPRQ